MNIEQIKEEAVTEHRFVYALQQRLHVFDQKYSKNSNIVKYYYNVK